MGLTVFLLLLSLVIILICAELFTNAVEWLGLKLKVNEGVVGSVFAAVGTAMPETLIPIVAVLFVGSAAGAHGEEVGIGAILGAPFMLATLAMFVTGLAIWIFSRSGRRTTTLSVNTSVLGRDIRFFLIAYVIAIATAFVDNRPLKIIVAIGLLALYIYYVYRHASEEEQTHELEEELEEGMPHQTQAEELGALRFQPGSKDPLLGIVALQLILSLGVMVVGATMFVEQVSAVANVLGVPALILSLLIAPIATELPEKFNSILWVRRGKDTLALGNISGAMVFQSCFPVSFGLLFTHWDASQSPAAFISAGMALAAGLLLYVFMRTGQRTLRATMLLMCGGFYLAYVVYLAVAVLPAGGAAH